MSLQIIKIEPANSAGSVTGAAITGILAPSKYDWGKKDISGPKAGRTQSMVMLKMRKGKVRTLDLAWNNKTYAQIAQVFQAFDYEYIWLTYRDALTGSLERKHFYMGDFRASSYTATKGGRWSMATLTCIQATPDPG